MGMPRKGTRLIVVDGRSYRWAVSVDRDFWGPSVCIEQDGAGGQRLRSGFFFPGLAPRIADRVPAVLDQVTPEVVRRLIVAGLAQGWKPEQRGLAPLWIDGAVIQSVVA